MSKKVLQPNTLEYWEQEEHKEKLIEWYSSGLNKTQIGKNIGISRSALYQWEKKSKHIQDILHESKAIKTEIVVNALFKRAIGYDHEDIEYRYDENGNEYPYRKFRKHYPGDPSLIKYYANNTDPANWKDKVDYQDTQAHDKLDSILDKMKEQAK